MMTQKDGVIPADPPVSTYLRRLPYLNLLLFQHAQPSSSEV